MTVLKQTGERTGGLEQMSAGKGFASARDGQIHNILDVPETQIRMHLQTGALHAA